MDSGEWPADWAMYVGNNTGLGFDLLWVVGIACAVAAVAASWLGAGGVRARG